MKFFHQHTIDSLCVCVYQIGYFTQSISRVCKHRQRNSSWKWLRWSQPLSLFEVVHHVSIEFFFLNFRKLSANKTYRVSLNVNDSTTKSIRFILKTIFQICLVPFGLYEWRMTLFMRSFWTSVNISFIHKFPTRFLLLLLFMLFIFPVVFCRKFCHKTNFPISFSIINLSRTMMTLISHFPKTHTFFWLKIINE